MSTGKKKSHLPAPGMAHGLRGRAICGREATYRTGDHDLIRQRALENSEGICATCLRILRAIGAGDHQHRSTGRRYWLPYTWDSIATERCACGATRRAATTTNQAGPWLEPLPDRAS